MILYYGILLFCFFFSCFFCRFSSSFFLFLAASFSFLETAVKSTESRIFTLAKKTSAFFCRKKEKKSRFIGTLINTTILVYPQCSILGCTYNIMDNRQNNVYWGFTAIYSNYSTQVPTPLFKFGLHYLINSVSA